MVGLLDLGQQNPLSLDPMVPEQIKQQAHGTIETKEYYDEEGWKIDDDGRPIFARLFGVHQDGPIRQELHKIYLGRTRAALERVGHELNLLECGCGGNPATHYADLCAKYTGIDFSFPEKALAMARRALEPTGMPFVLKRSDVCDLPFEDNSFDAVYCAHTIYHIIDAEGQRRALEEMSRVVRPGGVVVLVAANPRPLFFPVRMARRVIADTPGLSTMANKIRPKPVLPYNPRTVRWMRRVLRQWGSVEVAGNGFVSTAFNQRVSEKKGTGRMLWRLVRSIDRRFPTAAAYLGCYVQITMTKR